MEILGAGKWLQLVRRKGWEFAHRPNVTQVAGIVATTRDNEALFVEQWREPIGGRTIEWPAGLIGDEDGAETLLGGARRELLEETGYDCDSLSILAQVPSSAGMTSEIITLVRARGAWRVGNGGGVGHERITVYTIAMGDVDTWVAAQAQAGLSIDPKVYAGLYFLALERE